MTERLRITGGTRRNRRLVSPPKNTIRPASDMIRQAVFNLLGDQIKGTVFYDVFAGTGIVGMEALSRGAERAYFLELDRSHVQLIRRNLTLARFGPEAVVRPTDAFAWARHFAPEAGKVIVFLGPPYPLCLGTNKEKIFKLVEDVAGRLDDDDYLILQYPREIAPEELPLGDHWLRHRHYGKSRIGIWKKDGALGDPIWTMKDAEGELDEEGDDDDSPAGDDDV
jgi:16S rRNA (guanine966-N2)-methyltransferase